MGLPPFYNTIFGEEETRAYSLPMMGVGVAYILVGAGVLSHRVPAMVWLL